MKRILLIGLAVLATVACKKITPEQRIDEITGFFNGRECAHAAWLESHDASKRIDYLTLNLAKTLKADDLWTLEGGGGTSLIAEFEGRTGDKNKEPEMTMITAALDDPAACGAALDILEAFRELKIQHKNTIRVAFYEPSADSTGLTGLGAINREFRESEELIVFDLALSSRDTTVAPHTFVLEEKPLFVRQMLEVVPPYFKSLGDYKFVQGTYPNRTWPLMGSVYRYKVDPADLAKETAAVTVLTYLLN
jgi:hypothetical protein